MGKTDKKLVFLLTFLLVVGILLIYARLNFNPVGFAVIGTITNEGDCVAANYSWENLTQCSDISGCVECADEEGCQEDCESCNELWGCVGDFCGDGTIQSPNDNGINEVCDDGVNNGEYNYCLTDCSGLGEHCGDGIINGNEECDGSDLGANTCTSEGFDEGSLTCDSDCTLNDNACTTAESSSSGDSGDEETDNVEIPSTTMITTNTVTETSSCTPNWECGEWGECAEGTQDRICTDINQCGSNEDMPETSQSCVVEIKETCFDGIKNQDEKGIDCGGLCERKCGIFSIVGSAISVPIDAGKNFVFKGMFGNVTKTIISIASLVLIIGGIVAFVLFKRGTIKLPLIKKIFQKKEEKEDTETF